RQRRIGEVDRGVSFSTPRVPEGVMAQPSAPQFSSRQAVIWVWRWPSPTGGTAMRMRTGNRRSATVNHLARVASIGVPYSFFGHTADRSRCPAAWALCGTAIRLIANPKRPRFPSMGIAGLFTQRDISPWAGLHFRPGIACRARALRFLWKSRGYEKLGHVMATYRIFLRRRGNHRAARFRG